MILFFHGQNNYIAKILKSLATRIYVQIDLKINRCTYILKAIVCLKNFDTILVVY